MAAWFDAHNHLQDARLGDPAPVIAAMKSAGVGGCVVNATSENDWDAVADLAKTHPDFVRPAFGIHPWHAHTATDGWLDRLGKLLEKFPQASLGECGLDRWVSEPALEIQLPIFAAQLQLARDMDRPLTVHCLKAWDALFETFAATPPPARFLMHSFGGSHEIADRLVRLGAWFSFSGYFLQPRKSAVLEVFRQLPRDRILMETDAPDMPPPADVISHPLPGNANHPANLPAIGTALAETLGIPPQEFADLTHANARRWLDG